MRFLVDERTHRAVFMLWCLGWLTIGIASLRPLEAMPLGLSDKLVHVAGYGIMSAAVAGFCHETRAVVAWCGLVVVLGAALEAAQIMVPHRDANWHDLVANVVGAGAGMVLALGWLFAVIRPLRRVAAGA